MHSLSLMMLWALKWGWVCTGCIRFAYDPLGLLGFPLAGYFHFCESILCGFWIFPLAGCFRIRERSFVRRGLVPAQDAFAFAKDPLCEEVLYPTISGTGKGACPFGFVRRSLKEKASFLFQTPSNKTVLRLCRRTPEIVVTRTGFKPVTF